MFEEDLANVFFDANDFADEAIHVDKNNEVNRIVGILKVPTKSHSHNSINLQLDNPQFLVPDMVAKNIDVGDKITPNDYEYELASPPVSNGSGVSILYLTSPKDGGEHRWQ